MSENEKEGLSLFQARDSIRNSVDARNNPPSPHPNFEHYRLSLVVVICTTKVMLCPKYCETLGKH